MQRLLENEAKRNNSGGSHLNLDEANVDELVDLTRGYSGSDLKELSQEAAMVPLRTIADI